MFERLIFERMETRIMVGVTMFVGIMLLVGWIAINEPGRMAAFDRQFLARSVERGAVLFSSRCAICHGPDGRGVSERAPALNNPQLFGHDFLAEINRQKTGLETEQLDLANEMVKTDTTQERRNEITTRLADIVTQLAALEEQRAALTDQLQPAIDVGYDPEKPSRAAQLGWAGTLRDLVLGTVTSGRPVSGSYWPQAMPAWGQLAGGPLRADQVEDIANYILNWDKGEGWTVEDLLAVNQFAKVPGQEAQAAVEGAIGTDVAAIMTQLATVTGDPAKGDAIYHGTERTAGGRKLPCASCHEAGAGTLAPPLAGTWTRIQNERLTLPEFAGYTGEQYIAESLTDPSKFLAGGFADAMPKTFGNQLTVQDLADLIAYLKTQQ